MTISVREHSGDGRRGVVVQPSVRVVTGFQTTVPLDTVAVCYIELRRRQGPSAFVAFDSADVDLVRGYTWNLYSKRRNNYAITHTWRSGKRTTVFMHSVITGWPYVDHRDGDGLNNRRSNLRLSNGQLNAANQRSVVGSSSSYKGVSWKIKNGKWCAGIKINGKSIHIGLFSDEVEAARAYDAAAREVWGDHAQVNFGG